MNKIKQAAFRRFKEVLLSGDGAEFEHWLEKQKTVGLYWGA